MILYLALFKRTTDLLNDLPLKVPEYYIRPVLHSEEFNIEKDPCFVRLITELPISVEDK